MLNADRYRLQFFTYLFVILIHLFPLLFHSLVLGLHPTIFQISTSRISFKHHLVKQIKYCYLVLGDTVHVMLYTAQ